MKRKPPALKATFAEAAVLAVGLSVAFGLSAFAGWVGIAGGVALALVVVAIVWFMRSRRSHTGDTYVLAGLTGWETASLVAGCACSARFFVINEVVAYVAGFFILSGALGAVFLSRRQRIRELNLG